MIQIFIYERGKKTCSVFTGNEDSTIGEAIESAGLSNIAEFAIVNGTVFTQDDFNDKLDTYGNNVFHVEVVPYDCGNETENRGKLSYLRVVAEIVATEIAIAIPLLIYCRYFWIG